MQIQDGEPSLSKYTAIASWLLFILVAFAAQACTFPYISNPRWEGTYDDALRVIQDTRNDLDYGFRVNNTINNVTGVGTFVGVGGAGVAAAVKGTRDLIVGLATGGAANFALNSLYGSKTQLAIYMNGLEAINCVENSIGPIRAAHNRLQDYAREISALSNKIELYLNHGD